MNINDFFSKVKGTAPIMDKSALGVLFTRRSLTFRDFCQLESRHGLLTVDTPLTSSKGQDSYRLLVYRFEEELYESLAAFEKAHVLEEAIDAINYLWAIPLIEAPFSFGEVTKFQGMVMNTLINNLSFLEDGSGPRDLNTGHILKIMDLLFLEMSPLLRNRAWMNNTQQTDFAYRRLAVTIGEISWIILGVFRNWPEFWEYFIAKDEVLQFRLKSGY